MVVSMVASKVVDKVACWVALMVVSMGDVLVASTVELMVGEMVGL